jgi:hypothetical protein
VSDTRVHLHRLVEAVGPGGRVAAPAALAHDDRREVEAEGLADARLDAAIGGAAADDDVAPWHVQELGDAPNSRFVGKARGSHGYGAFLWQHGGSFPTDLPGNDQETGRICTR